MAEAFITRRGSSPKVYEVSHETITLSVDADEDNNKLIISGLDLPDNILTFNMSFIVYMKRSPSINSSGAQVHIVTFTLLDTGDVRVVGYYPNDGDTSPVYFTDEYNFIGEYEVVDGELYIWLTSEEYSYRLTPITSKSGYSNYDTDAMIREGIIVCN